MKWEEAAEIDIPEGVTANQAGTVITVKGPKGEVKRNLPDNYLRISIEGSKIKITMSKKNRRNNGILGTWTSELKSMINGVTSGFEYHMKIDYTHFPMRVSVRGNAVVVENFLGERSARIANIIGNTKVNVKGDRLTIEGIDKREIGETSANIERATKIRRFDPRIFQDGIYLLKGGE
ncbi:50S ribosomal protein L6 [uncultured archaeon]|nr:50S ribosomal protein L6 [uncultured archaeon]